MRISAVLAIFSASFLSYLTLSAGSGPIGAWSAEEIAVGAAVALLAGIVLAKAGHPGFSLDLKRVPASLASLLAWSASLLGANLDVACRVFTGKTDSGIVRVGIGKNGDLATFAKAASITLTPGTISVDERGGSVYVHCIDLGRGPK